MKKKKKVSTEVPPAPPAQTQGLLTPKVQYILLIGIAFIFYGNTLFNKYALDDGLVISENPFTTQGFSGIDDIFLHDSYYGFYQKHGSEGELTGGRYRPLSIATFAVEYEIFGLSPGISHFVNVLLYALTLVFLLFLLQKYLLFRNPVLAFLSVLLFAIHPIHTEVVANIKSRDELLSLLFLALTLIFVFRHYLESGRVRDIAFATMFYMLALFSKENGITFLAVIPLALFLFTNMSVGKALRATIPFLIVAAGYLVIRFYVVGMSGAESGDIMNDPFLYATGAEKYATIFYILLYYLQLLIFPHPLSYDYGYYAMEYQTFADPLVITSILVHIALVTFGIFRLRKGSVISFAILFYFITLSIVSNLFVDLGGTLGERLIYHSSLGFCIAIAWLLIVLFEKINIPFTLKKFSAAWAIILVIFVLAGIKTIARNNDWKNNRTLFIADVRKVPNSIKANTAAGNEFIQRHLETQDPQDLQLALSHLQKADQIYPEKQDKNTRDLYMFDNYLQQGYVYYTFGNIPQAEAMWKRAGGIKPDHPKIKEYNIVLSKYFVKEGDRAATQQNIPKAIENYQKAVEFYDPNSEAWYNLGGAYYTTGNLLKAKEAFEKTLELYPNHPQAQQGLNAVLSQLQK